MSIDIKLEGFEHLQARLGRISRGLSHLSPLMTALAAVGESQTRRRIESEKRSPEGIPWKPLSPGYQEWKLGKSSGGILELTGHLLDSLTAFADQQTAGWGTNLVYAATHQFGRGNIPARPFLGVSDENIEELQAIVDDYADKLLS